MTTREDRLSNFNNPNNHDSAEDFSRDIKGPEFYEDNKVENVAKETSEKVRFIAEEKPKIGTLARVKYEYKKAKNGFKKDVNNIVNGVKGTFSKKESRIIRMDRLAEKEGEHYDASTFFENSENKKSLFSYENFLKYDQEIFKVSINAKVYTKKIINKFGSIEDFPKDAKWLFHHHRSEMYLQAGNKEFAIQDIKIAFENNVFDNDVTKGLYYSLTMDNFLEELKINNPTEYNSLKMQLHSLDSFSLAA